MSKAATEWPLGPLGSIHRPAGVLGHTGFHGLTDMEEHCNRAIILPLEGSTPPPTPLKSRPPMS